MHLRVGSQVAPINLLTAAIAIGLEFAGLFLKLLSTDQLFLMQAMDNSKHQIQLEVYTAGMV